jgi:hypothetical protein
MVTELCACILGGKFIQSLEYHEMEVDKTTFQQDNDLSCCSKWYMDNGIKVLDWPA